MPGFGPVALSPDGKSFVTAHYSPDGGATVHRWSVADAKELGSFKADQYEIRSMVFSTNGKSLAVAGQGLKVLLLDARNGQKRWAATSGGSTFTVRFADKDKLVVFNTGSGDYNAVAVKAANGKQARVFKGHTDSVSTLDVSRDGKFLLTGSRDKSVKLWQLKGGKVVCTL